MLSTLRLHNFRTYLNAELRFTSRHLIIGRNNSGKTNLCAALRFLGATATGDLARATLAVPGGVSEIKNWAFHSSIVELSCICDLPFEGAPLRYKYDLKLSAEPPTAALAVMPHQPVLKMNSEYLIVNGGGFRDTVLLSNDGRESHLLHEKAHLSGKGAPDITTRSPSDSTMLSKLYELETNQRAVMFRRYLSSWSFYAISPERVRFGWREAQVDDVGLGLTGHNLAVMLYHVKTFNDRAYRSILEHVRTIEPELKAINFLTYAGQVPTPFVELERRAQASWTGLSDGTLRCLALALLAEASRPSPDVDAIHPLVVVEEPENGIFPGQLREFFDLFEERSGGGQFIFTSHSPYFINFFDAQRQSVTELRRSNERTEVLSVPPPDDSDPERPLLAEEYSLGLLE